MFMHNNNNNNNYYTTSNNNNYYLKIMHGTIFSISHSWKSFLSRESSKQFKILKEFFLAFLPCKRQNTLLSRNLFIISLISLF